MNNVKQQRAQWIGYPGDFEMMLNLRVHTARYERGMQIAPMWRLDSFYQCVKFRRKFSISLETVIHIRVEGTAAVELDRLGSYCYGYQDGIRLEKGEHFLVVTVFNSYRLPSVFIDNDQLKTDKKWEVSCSDGDWVSAGYWDFTDPLYPPSTLKLETKVVNAISTEESGRELFLDFGMEFMGCLKFENVKGFGKVNISYGESKEEALDFDNSMIIDRFDINGDFITTHPFAFRYVFLKYGEGVEIGRVSCVYEYLPIENKGSFESDNQLVNNIYKVSLHTLHLNSREFFLDGIKRDRWVWGGDAFQSYLLNYYSFFDVDICKRTINVLRGRDPVKQHHNTIQDYTCFWFISLYDYYMHTGDKEFVIQKYDSARILMDFCLERADNRGFMNSQSKDWVFVDWAPINNNGDISFIQILFARSLETMALLAEVCGKTQESMAYRELFNKTITNCFEVFWSTQYSCFTHGPAASPDAVVTKYANIFALIFDYLDKEKRRLVIENAIINNNVLKITTPYMKFYELFALCEAGHLKYVKEYIEEYWGGMLALGATSFWEVYDPDNKGPEHYSMYGRPYGKSLCHAWGAGPIYLLGKYFLGVKPTKPGYLEFEVSPVLLDFQYVKGMIPTPEGVIEVLLNGEKLEVANNTPGKGRILSDGIVETIGPYEKKIIRKG